MHSIASAGIDCGIGQESCFARTGLQSVLMMVRQTDTAQCAGGGVLSTAAKLPRCRASMPDADRITRYVVSGAAAVLHGADAEGLVTVNFLTHILPGVTGGIPPIRARIVKSFRAPS
jgi:hypothetical protein